MGDKKYDIIIDTRKCTGCLRCALACSYSHTRTFRPSAAHVHVALRGADASIEFDDDCSDCGLCADQCFYGALEKRKSGDAA